MVILNVYDKTKELKLEKKRCYTMVPSESTKSNAMQCHNGSSKLSSERTTVGRLKLPATLSLKIYSIVYNKMLSRELFIYLL